MQARASSVLADLDADFDADTPVSSLSIAQKHVVQIARALVNDSRLLILDEPTASLSQRECAELFRIARKLRDVEASSDADSTRLLGGALDVPGLEAEPEGDEDAG